MGIVTDCYKLVYWNIELDFFLKNRICSSKPQIAFHFRYAMYLIFILRKLQKVSCSLSILLKVFEMCLLSKQIDNNVAPCAPTFPRDDRANDTVEKKNKIFFWDGITSRMASKCSFSQNCKALFYDLAFSQSNKNLFSTSVAPNISSARIRLQVLIKKCRPGSCHFLNYNFLYIILKTLTIDFIVSIYFLLSV